MRKEREMRMRKEREGGKEGGQEGRQPTRLLQCPASASVYLFSSFVSVSHPLTHKFSFFIVTFTRKADPEAAAAAAAVTTCPETFPPPAALTSPPATRECLCGGRTGGGGRRDEREGEG